jgi:steroid delta-isomerase-like uncharacterized protein
MTTDTKVLARREIEEAFTRGELEALDQLVADDYISYDPTLPEPIRGRDAYRAHIASIREGIPNLVVRIDDQIAEADKVVTRWTATGRHEGTLFGVPPTGNDVEMTGISIERVDDGLIVEDWVLWDALGLMRQLGVVSEFEEV